jgi:predicted MFS family arabinose efflux permease
VARFSRPVLFTVIISALGYFVDIYDLLLFGIVRVPSLRALGVPEDQMLTVGVRLLNMQMSGMLIGGVIWGVIGDRRGRRSVLFGSILLYSLANIANAFVTSPEMYGWLRLAAGIGLAGELGAAITLVSEVMSKEDRGYGTAIVAGIGILGAVVASLIGDTFSWKVAYIVGGSMGLGLLALRAGLLESGLFDSMAKRREVQRGHFHQLFLKLSLFRRYAGCILIGLPIWFSIGVLVTFAPELAHELGVQGTITGSKAIMWAYAGGSMGDLSAGLLSQYLRSRKKTVALFIALTAILLAVYVTQAGWTVTAFYILCWGLGIGTGYWSVFATIAAEQFGTNLRATVATTVPNFVRGSVVLVTLGLRALASPLGLVPATFTIGIVLLIIAAVELYFMRETYGRDLDYFETV